MTSVVALCIPPGVYPIAVVPMIWGAEMPKRIAAAGIKDEGTGVDLAAGITLEYEGKGNK